ncbi:hypothetical protein FHW88_002523 [Mucilaginibacter sp. SG538B]|uniref:hypothetical protein n=1 Tax=Mucilaginibacter sp. SG538B TaxID=2587021 RepID=UPI00159D9220|nr:hypothetical protein [Mucilaginibacter sp. SG538B]NVM64195.1 hypothetical protein [Mucilaginibacter sp. SG538B]NVM64234.1 hypothetical protein [Mucilaginibacter sp. SG538B]
MYCGVYAPWDHAPKFLRFSEVMDPMIPVKYFFDADDVEGHQETLKTWRHHVVNDGFYSDKRFGPGVLFHDYELNIRLIEGLYLLFLEHQEFSYEKKKVDVEQLSAEKEEWLWFPAELSEKELLNPYVILEAAFDEVKPQEFRDHLVEWLAAALSTHAIDESMSPGEIITVYEHLKKMYSAAWLIFQRDTEHAFFKFKATKVKPQQEDINHTTETDTNTAPPAIEQSPASKLALKEVVKAILNIEPAVRAIIQIGTLENPFGYILYIMIDEPRHELDYLVNELIENSLKPLIDISTIVASVSSIKNGNTSERKFLTWVLTNGIIIYETDGLGLDNLNAGNNKLTLNTLQHESRLKFARLYYTEISYHFRKKDFRDALQAVHRSIEATLMEYLDVKVGFETTIPNLNRLVTMTLIIDSKVSDWFLELKSARPELYDLLQSVYPETIRNSLNISEQEIMDLMGKAADLMILILSLLNE